MRWKTQPLAPIGSVRTKSGFLWMIKTIGNETRWLENASWIERLEHWCDVTSGFSGDVWMPVSWCADPLHDPGGIR